MEKRQSFNKWCWENCKTMRLAHFLTSYSNSKRIKDLNIRPEIIKFLEETIGRTLSEMYQHYVYESVSWGKRNESKNKWDLIKFIKLLHEEHETINKKTTHRRVKKSLQLTWPKRVTIQNIYTAPAITK